MKIKHYLVIVLLLSLSMVASAQTNFIKGYIIDLNNDTIWGEIDNRNYVDNAKFCNFRLKEEGAVTTYTPIEIKGYALAEGVIYRSEVIDKKPLFLELLVEGSINLYFYKNEKSKVKYYVSKDTSELFLLKYEKQTRNKDGKEYAYVSKPYIGLFYYLMSDVPNMKYFIDQLNAPKRETLIPLVNMYNQKKGYANDTEVIVKQFNRKKFLSIHGITYYPVEEAESVEKKFRHGFAVDFLFQQINVHKRLYLGAGIASDGGFGDNFMDIRIPLSIYYLHPKEGFSPVFYYQFNLTNFVTQAAGAGLRYKFGKFSTSAEIDAKTILFVFPYLVSAKIGLFYEF